jgi:hypothetical protein
VACSASDLAEGHAPAYHRFSVALTLMYIVWILIKIAVQTYLLKVLLAQTYNVIFMIAARPIIWAVVAALLGAGYVVLAFELSWDPGIVSWVVIAVTMLSWPPAASNAISKQEMARFAEEVYAELGIARGRLKYRLGVLGFALFSGMAYILVFGQVCTYEGQCTPFISKFVVH